MLPGQRGINVVGYNTGPLPLRIHEKFGAQGEVVQLVWRVIDIQQERLLVRIAGQRSRVTAMCCVRSIERHDLWAEGRAAVGDGGCRYWIIQVRNIEFVDIPGLKGDVPVIANLW
jgi:hypothetical protein